MSRNRNRNAMQNTFKDYLVPIIGGVILIILFLSLFGGDDTQSIEQPQSSENKNPVEISFSTEGTEAFIMYPGDERKEIQAGAELYKGESVIVKEGIVSLVFGNDNTISLNKVAELKYNENASLSLYSSDAWIELAEDTEIAMRYVTVEAPAGSVLSLTQNEASSTVYVLDGSAKVTNLGGASTSMITGQKLSVARQYAADEDADLAGDKGNIDSYFKSSDWFIENDGISVLNRVEEIDADNGDEELGDDTGTVSTQGESGVYLNFDNIRDEGTIDSGTLDITGTVLIESVELITINGKQAEISADNTFVATGVNTNSSINDIVIKVYDESRAILEKNVITLYNSNPTQSTTTQSVATNNIAVSEGTVTNSQGVTTFGVDATDFGFTEPSESGKFSTTASEITIRGYTTAENISKVLVNGFELASFNGSTWRYHAFERFETLESGTNQYKVDYYGEAGSILYTDYYTIVKRDSEVTQSQDPVATDAEEAPEEQASEIPPEEDLFQ